MIQQTTYLDAGVDIDAADQLIEKITPFVKKTHRPEVVSHLGGYAGLFALDLKKYPEPLIVSTTDGVGTKLKIAFEMKRFDTIGQDLVAMCVNDLLCVGAEPLFFLDYFATSRLDVTKAQTVIKGIAKALEEINCTLIGGETAEMPGFYAKGEFDLAGFAVGVVNRDRVVEGQRICEGDKIIGLASSGVHSNSFSLIRKIIEQTGLNIHQPVEGTASQGLDKPLGEILLTPTRIYVKPVLNLLKNCDIRGIAHITGGGLIENVPRILPPSVTACFETKKIKIPPLFRFFQGWGTVPEEEMWRVFNMGIGMILVVDPSQEKEVLAVLEKENCPAMTVGEIRARRAKEPQVRIE